MSNPIPNIITGDTIIKSNTNTTRYGNGKLIIDSGITTVKEIVTPPVAPASTYDNIFVDSTSKNVRVQNSSNVTRDVGINRVTVPLATAGVTIAANTDLAPVLVFRGFLSVLNGTPKNISILIRNTNAASRTIRIRILNTGPLGAAATVLFDNSPTPPTGLFTLAGTTSFVYNISPPYTNPYPTTNSIISISVGRGAGGGAAVLVDHIYIDY